MKCYNINLKWTVIFQKEKKFLKVMLKYSIKQKVGQ